MDIPKSAFPRDWSHFYIKRSLAVTFLYSLLLLKRRQLQNYENYDVIMAVQQQCFVTHGDEFLKIAILHTEVKYSLQPQSQDIKVLDLVSRLIVKLEP